MTTPRIEDEYHHIDHSHCWEKENPPCGQKIKHFKCCLCEMLHPEIAQAHQAGIDEAVEIVENAKEVFLPTTGERRRDIKQAQNEKCQEIIKALQDNK